MEMKCNCVTIRSFRQARRPVSTRQVSRFLVIAWVVGPLGWLSGRPGVQSYKLSETPIISPINLTNSDDPTVAEKAGPCDTPKSTPSSGAVAC